MPNQPKTPTRAIRIPDDTWAELQRIATGQRLPVSELVRDVLRNYVEKEGQR